MSVNVRVYFLCVSFVLLRSFSRISSSDIFFFLVLSRGRGTEGPGAGLALGGLLAPPSAVGGAGTAAEAVAAGGEMGEVAASLVGGGGMGSITDRVYIWESERGKEREAEIKEKRKREGEIWRGRERER